MAVGPFARQGHEQLTGGHEAGVDRGAADRPR